MHRILSTLDRWWSNWLSYVTVAAALTLLVTGHLTRSAGLNLAGLIVLGTGLAVTAVYVVLAVQAYRRLRLAHRPKRHEPTTGCHGIHCYSCGLDEPPAPAYIVCGECGHVYRTARALRQAWRRTDLRTRWMANSGPGSSWRFRIAEIVFAVPLLVTVRAGRIYDCPKCGHDF